MDALTRAQISPADPNRAKISACLRERKIHGRGLVLVVMQRQESNETDIPIVTWDDLLAAFRRLLRIGLSAS